MFEAVDAIALLRAVLADECRSDDVARKHLIEARRRDMARAPVGNVASLAPTAGQRQCSPIPAHPRESGDPVLSSLTPVRRDNRSGTGAIHLITQRSGSPLSRG